MPDFNRPPLMTHLRPESHLPSVSHCPPHLSPSIFAQTVQQPQTLLTVPPLHPTGVEQRTLEHGRTQLRDATRGNAKRKLPRTSSLVFIINLLAKMKNDFVAKMWRTDYPGFSNKRHIKDISLFKQKLSICYM